MSDDADAWLDRTLPLDDVGSGQVDLAGRLAEYVDRLAAVTDRLTGTHPLDALARRARRRRRVADRRPRRPTRWQVGQVQRELGRVRAPQARAAAASTCGCPTCGRCSADRLAGRPTRANFRTGTLTVCTMVPMRSVPHRVVCLLGLDDGVFPRVGVGRRRRRAGPATR